MYKSLYRSEFNNWMENVDPNEKQELVQIENKEDVIKERFSYPLAFGTAGMRGIIGLGTANMNVYTVRRATQGFASYIRTKGEKECAKGVLISYDTRKMSFEFALAATQVLVENKIKVYLFEDVRPVPMCSFAIRNLECAAGIMITASHNPKNYNGYKVYGSDGAQLDLEATDVVVEFIKKQTDYFSILSADVNINTSADIKGLDDYEIHPLVTIVGKSIDEKFYTELEKFSYMSQEIKKNPNIATIVYTPIHGTGYKPVTTMLDRIGVNYKLVQEQVDPDTEFSTVTVPNPEDPKALSMAVELSKQIGADIVIGTDPDCDRMGIAIKDDKDEYKILTGNEIGILLLNYIIEIKKENKELEKNSAVIKTIVTTKLTDKIAKANKVKVFDVLTGFKFIGEKIKEWETKNRYKYILGFEESCGYLIGTYARDKDAVGSSMMIAEMTYYYKKQSKTLFDVLTEIYEKFGYFKEISTSISFEGISGMSKMQEIMKKLIEQRDFILAGYNVKRISDYNKRWTMENDGSGSIIKLPASNVIKYEFNNYEWACIRPSGTEPKLKIYVSAYAKGEKKAKIKANKILKDLQEIIKNI